MAASSSSTGSSLGRLDPAKISKVDESGKHSLADLRSIQDWSIRYDLQAVPGVAEVASLGGFVRQYQVTVDPNRLASYGIPLMKVVEAIRSSNNEVGGRLVEWSGAEYMVRARGYIRSITDLEEIVVKTGERGTPVRLRDVAEIGFVNAGALSHSLARRAQRSRNAQPLPIFSNDGVMPGICLSGWPLMLRLGTESSRPFVYGCSG